MTRTDEQIKRDIVDSLFWDNRIDASRITVEVNDGNVELSGQVPTHTARIAARDDAEVISGVVSVRNLIDVNYLESIPIPTDEEMQSNIENALAWDPNVEIHDISLNVKHGWVTVEGTTDSFWKKVKAEDIVSNMAGVIGVTNKLAVVPSEDIVDKSIAEDITSALDRTLDTELDNINIEVKNGTVTVSGTAPSLPIKRAVDEIISYTSGVADVNDELVVAGI